MGQVIHCGGAARDPKIHNLFQISDVDSGVIRWVNADLVTHTYHRSYEGAIKLTALHEAGHRIRH